MAKPAPAEEGVVMQNGTMAVRVVVSLAEASDLWCIHHDGDWEDWLAASIVRTIEAHLPRGLALRVSVAFERAVERTRGDG